MKIKGQLAERIEKINTGAESQVDVKRKQQQESVQNSHNTKVEQDTVSLSLAKTIQTELIEVDHERLANLKRLVQEGKYEVSSTVLAQKVADTVDDEVFFSRLLDK